MSFKYGLSTEEVVNRRKDFLKKLDINIEDCFMPSLTHGNTVMRVESNHRGSCMLSPQHCFEAEAVITNCKRLGLFILTADCFPVIYYDSVHQAIGLAHLGRRPAQSQLAAKVIKSMNVEFGTEPKDVEILIGPGIHKESYLVEVMKQEIEASWKPYLKIVAHTDLISIDLLGFIQDQLTDAGVLTANIKIEPVDTVISADYFSHYRSKRSGEPEGRFATVVMLN
ncbi:polyphenol oxidase family protein [Candidatus Nomurabacteria bacterium]|nr:polyphenol oxidase family protein [Candidatus Nomurabacteria bacterium]